MMDALYIINTGVSTAMPTNATGRIIPNVATVPANAGYVQSIPQSFNSTFVILVIILIILIIGFVVYRKRLKRKYQ